MRPHHHPLCSLSPSLWAFKTNRTPGRVWLKPSMRTLTFMVMDGCVFSMDPSDSWTGLISQEGCGNKKEQIYLNSDGLWPGGYISRLPGCPAVYSLCYDHTGGDNECFKSEFMNAILLCPFLSCMGVCVCVCGGYGGWEGGEWEWIWRNWNILLPTEIVLLQ